MNADNATAAFANPSSSLSEEETINNNDNTDTLGGHLVAGCFLLAFGGFFLGLTAFRLNRIAAALAFLERNETSPRTSEHGATSSSTTTRARSPPILTPASRVVVAENHQHHQEHDSDHSNGNGDENSHSHPSHHHAMTVMMQGNHHHHNNNNNNSDHHHHHHHHPEPSVDDPSDHVTLWARTYCRQHIPEYNTDIVYRTSLALLLSTISGLVLESVGGVWIHFEDHPDHTLTSYSLHETITLLFLVVGITGYWEALGYLPRDSIRAALVAAFGGEALLWHVHASHKADTTTAWIHEAMSWLGAGTAVTMLLSILGSRQGGGTNDSGRSSLQPRIVEDPIVDGVGEYPCTLFFLHITSFILIAWQGCWFITAGKHSTSPMQSDRVPCYFVLQGLLLFVMTQAYLIVLVRRYQPKRHYGRLRQTSIVREHSPAMVQVELNGA